MSSNNDPHSAGKNLVGALPPDPSTIPGFDRVMRGLMNVPKSELAAELKRHAKQKRIKKK